MDAVLLPFTEKISPFDRPSGFHLRPKRRIFPAGAFSIFFGADISTTGYYGFPLNQGVVKIANHGQAARCHPILLSASSPAKTRTICGNFLRSDNPRSARPPIVYTRVCMYCDTK